MSATKISLDSPLYSQYIETLIRLIEMNNDHEWLQCFLEMRDGKGLPGGGAGSLNDWGPSYTGARENVWYGIAYEICRYLYDDSLPVEMLSNYKSEEDRILLRVIRCLNCQGRYQHPHIFERNPALTFYLRYFSKFANENRLIEFLRPELSFQCAEINQHREWLIKEYEKNNIRIYDFIAMKYLCPHCGMEHKSDHDFYRIFQTASGEKTFSLYKTNV